MKAAIFIPTLTAGGAERVASILANAWCRYPGVDVTVILMFEDEIFFPVEAKVKIRNLGLRTNLGPGIRAFALAKALGQLRKVIKEEKPDFVLSFMNKYNVFCLAALWGAGVPVIVSERDSPTEPNRRVVWVLRAWLYPKSRGVITQSRESEAYLALRIPGLNVAVIPNPIVTTVEPVHSGREQFVLNVGRLAPKKGQADLVKAFAQVDQSNWRLVFCGEGPLRGELQALAQEHGIAERVTFAGRVTDVGAWCARAGIFAFPSYFEGFPNALAEAMLTGAPVVSYDCPTGPSELISEGENGYLVPVGDVSGLAARLRMLMVDRTDAERISRNAAKVAEKVSAPAICAAYFNFCAEAAGRVTR